MGFLVTQKTLERLEWKEVLAMLGERARTPGVRRRCAVEALEGESLEASLFEPTRRGVLERLAETGEARNLLAAGEALPLGSIPDLEQTLTRARKDGVLAARELLNLASALRVTHEARRFLELRRESAPRLADLAETLVEQRDLERDIDASLEPSGEVRDSASPTLASARRDTQRIASEIQAKLSHYLQAPNITPHLSDTYYTIRNNRYVLPVRADSRGGIAGIVHDASNSGMTLYIEPEPLVELNNQLKRAEITIEREILRILRVLSREAGSAADSIEANIATLEIIDLAFARAALAEDFDAVAPEIGNDGMLQLPQLRHPLLPIDAAVPSDLRIGSDFTALILSGPNAGGKTVALKAAALAALFVRAGMHVLAAEGARVDLFDEVLAHIGDEQDISENLSTFSAHMANLADITRRATNRSLVVLDEIGVGTDPGEGAALAQAALETLADRGARVIATTHYNLLKEMAEVDARFANASVEFDSETLEPTYRLRMGLPGTSSATSVAARMGLDARVIARANELLDREDRQLDRVLAELSASRSALEAEQREIAELKSETEAVRDEHRAKLERLQARRDKLFLSMREDLEQSFRDAHEQVASVIRELQRGGSARDAAAAREKLQAIASDAEASQREAGLEAPTDELLNPIDWPRAAAGDLVQILGGGRGVLSSLPDQRGRVTVQLGSARLSVPMERVGAAEPTENAQPAPRAKPRITVTRSASAEGPAELEADADRCDLHGLRVDEALDRLAYALDRAASVGRPTLAISHGRGTGTLRKVVREYLRDCPFISHFATAAQQDGGDGVTIAFFR
ncbi:MAG: endonuclease MutS2 [Deltaproteobacteria bacterium]|jgi:DNA mismatch repair protein MutS2|nr:endonuclease MutS2 [Deltaproteobacteria bacterium]